MGVLPRADQFGGGDRRLGCAPAAPAERPAQYLAAAVMARSTSSGCGRIAFSRSGW